MKLQYIYVLLGAATLVLNLLLTVHLFRRNSPGCREVNRDDELITFRLDREHSIGGLTTAAVPYDETLLIEEEQ